MRPLFSAALMLALVSFFPSASVAVEYKEAKPGMPCTTRDGEGNVAPPGYCIASQPRPAPRTATPEIIEMRRKARESPRARVVERIPAVKTGVIEKTCLMSWEDSHQIHKQELRIEWDHQSYSTEMKKLEHCIEIKLVGPIDIEGFAKGYVDHCTDYALNHRRVEYAFRAIGALVADIYGAGGSASAANTTEWVNMVASETLNCLSDTAKLEDFTKEYLSERFDATVEHKMKWVYWWL